MEISAKKLTCLMMLMSAVLVGCGGGSTKKSNRYKGAWASADFSKLRSLGCSVEEKKERKIELHCPADSEKSQEIAEALRVYKKSLGALQKEGLSWLDTSTITLLRARVSVLSISYIIEDEILSELAKMDVPSVPELLYPDSDRDQKFTEKFFKILELHKKEDPFLGGRGPSVPKYDLNEMLFAFMINDEGEFIDLAIFNWNLESQPGFEYSPILSIQYAKPVYILRGVKKEEIVTQDGGVLSNFSYILGADYIKGQIERSTGEAYEGPTEFLDFKPHDKYLDRNSELRKALGEQSLILLAPGEKYFYAATALDFDGMSEAEKENIRVTMSGETGETFENKILGMMVHESFHVHESLTGKSRNIPDEREELLEDMQSSKELKKLMSLYAKVVFTVADGLVETSVSDKEIQSLEDLKFVIQKLKKTPNAWNYIRSYEYTEGFAEYVSAYSLMKINAMSLQEAIDLQKKDSANNFVYRTGALAGLFLNLKLGQMPFSKQEDHRYGAWEIVIEQLNIEVSKLNIRELLDKYSQYDFDEESELKRVEEYLESTVWE